LSVNLRKRICDILSRVSEKEAKFISECFGELCNITLIDLSNLEEGRLKKLISSETYRKIDELKKSTYKKMQEDAKLYASELEKREAEINTLLYEMKLDLSN
jgi:hypothetical protein